MKLATFDAGNGKEIGVVVGDSLTPITRLQPQVTSAG
jgi:hypothetical protein